MKLRKILSGCLAAVMLVSTVTVASAASAKKEAKDFPDFDKDAWYAEAVSAAVDNDLLRGTDKGKLNPQGNLTRAEMAAIANRAFGTYVKANITKFKDVSKNAKLVGFSLNGAGTVKSAEEESLSLTRDWTIPQGGSLDLDYDAVVSAVSQAVKSETILSAIFVLKWS